MIRRAIVVAALALACKAKDDCPTDLPTCPPTPPSFASTIVPLIQADCYPCHGPGGTEDKKTPLSTYNDVFMIRGSVLTQIYQCKMPETGPLVEPDRDEILEWLECNAPNN